MTYRVFKRSCTNWQEFSSAEKQQIDSGLEYNEAREMCKSFNNNRTEEDKISGTMLEFESE